jgi:adenylosuccinate lyase
MKDLQLHTENMRQNLELTQGLVFSQRVLLALIDKGLSRQKAYEMVQRNAMKAWKQKMSFLNLLESDTEVTSKLTRKELETIFDYIFFLKHVDTIFKRLGLMKTSRTATSTKSSIRKPKAL